MTTTTDVLVPALREVREAEAAVADRFRAHASVTPAGEYRQSLMRHCDEARRHVRRLDQRLADLQPRGLLQTALGGAWHLTGQAARFSLDLALAVPAAMLRGKASEEQLLRNAEDEYAAASYAVATCRAGERIAQETDDNTSSTLLHAIRQEVEKLLQDLGGDLEQRAEAVVAAAVHNGFEDRPEIFGAAQPVRTGAGAVLAEEQLPIPRYGTLTSAQIAERLPGLSQAQLVVVDSYERAHAGRSAILTRISQLLGPTPWPGYDSMTEDEIRARLRDAPAGTARQALEYERLHQCRPTVLSAAQQRSQD